MRQKASLFAASLALLAAAWAHLPAAPAGEQPQGSSQSRPASAAVVRALLDRSRLLADTHFQVPRGLYEEFLRDTTGAAPPAAPAPVPLVAEAGEYRLALDANREPTLTAAVRLRVFDPAGAAAVRVLSAALAWEKLAVDGQEARLATKGGWLIFTAPRAGQYVLTASAALKQAAPDGGKVDLAVPRTARTQLAFDSPGVWEVRAAGAPGAVRGRPGGGTHGVVSLPPWPSLSVRFAPVYEAPPRPPRFELRGTVAWNIDLGRQQVAADVRVGFLGGPTDRLELSLPPAGARVAVGGPDVREAQAGGAGQVAVFLRGRVSGQTRLSIAYEVSGDVSGVQRLAPPSLAGGHWAGGHVVVTNTAGEAELLASASPHLREISPDDLPAAARGLLPGQPVLAYEITGRDFAAAVDVVKLGELAMQESIADLAHWQLVFRPDGTMLCRADYEVRNRTRQFLRVTLPRGADVLLARVNDKPTEPRRVNADAGDQGATYLLPLVRSTATVKGLVSFPVRLVVLYRGEALRRRGRLALPLPRIDLPIAYGWCEAFVPDGLDVARWTGPLVRVERYSSETAAESMTYGRAELAEGYKPEDRPEARSRPEPVTEATSPRGGKMKAPLLGGKGFAHRAPVREERARTVLVKPRITLQNEPEEAPAPVPADVRGAPEPERGLGTSVPGSSLTKAGAGALLAANYWRAGQDYYAKGDLANAAESLSNAIRLKPNSPEAVNAERLLDNIRALRGELKPASREEKALARQVQKEVAVQSAEGELRQEETVRKAMDYLRAGRADEARAGLTAAAAMGKELLAQGADQRRQKARLEDIQKKLATFEESDKERLHALHGRYETLKEKGDYAGALQAGQELQRLAQANGYFPVYDGGITNINIEPIDASLARLRGELADLAVKSVKTQTELAYRAPDAGRPASATRAPQQPAAERRVAELTRQARELRERKDYTQALNAVEEVLRVDPGNTWAQRQRDVLSEFLMLVKEGKALHETRKEEQKFMDQRETEIPWFERLRYPKNWAQLTGERKEHEASAAGQSLADEAVRHKLRREIERLTLDEIDLKEVITFLREYSDANIQVNWRALAAAGIEPITKVSLDVRRVNVKRALELVLRDASAAAAGAEGELVYATSGGVVTISTRIDLARPAGSAQPVPREPAAPAPVRRVYDVRDLVVPVTDFEAAKASPDVAAVAQKRERTAEELVKQLKATLGEQAPQIELFNGQLAVLAVPAGQNAAGELLDRLRQIRGPNVQLGANIAKQQAGGQFVVQSDGKDRTFVTYDDLRTRGGVGGAGEGGGQGGGGGGGQGGAGGGDGQRVDATVAKDPELQQFLERNYRWQAGAGRAGDGRGVQLPTAAVQDLQTTVSVPDGGTVVVGGQTTADKGGAPILSKVPLITKLTSNLGQKVVVNSTNVNVGASAANALGVSFVNGVNGVNYAVVDEAQLRAVRELAARQGAAAAAVAPNDRWQETIVGTDALLANGGVANVAFAADTGNTLDLNGNTVVLPHEKYVLIDNGGYLTAVKAGEMQFWRQRPKVEAVQFADVPQEIEVPAVGHLVKFEKTLIEPADELVIGAEYEFRSR